jgi:RHS repeat-associated protein
LALDYDSGHGNGPYGLGWSLGLRAINRRTDKMLPTYHDAEEADVFQLSGAEDLVPVLDTNGQRLPLPDGYAPGYRVDRYRPRIDTLYAHIERWTALADGQTHWRSLSHDNITTRYGLTPDARITDPQYPTKVFSWLICDAFDDRGNIVVYDYLPEDSTNVDTSAAHEGHRAASDRAANRYLKRIRYGNRTPRVDGEDSHARTDWMFEAVLDYGDHDPDAPTPTAARPWLCRRDPSSTYKPGFEVRTYRLCQRILMFHHFSEDPDVGPDCLVSSTDLTYNGVDPTTASGDGRGDPDMTLLTAVTHRGYRRATGGYTSKALPAVEFDYSPVQFHDSIIDCDPDSLIGLPAGLAGAGTHWVDLDGEGINGVLVETPGALSYKANLGAGRFAAPELLPTAPNLRGIGGGRRQLADLTATGQLDLVDYGTPAPGFFARTPDGDWEPFRAFATVPVIDWDDPNLRFLDLDGNGYADVVLTEADTLIWYPSLSTDGFGPGWRTPSGPDDDHGPRIVFADADQSFLTADMSGDGLTDLVRVRNGEVAYWPNLGYGRFGAKVVMDGAPWMERLSGYDPKRVRMADIDGTGTVDLLYLDADRISIWRNRSGNGYAEPVDIRMPAVDDHTQIAIADILGSGTACVVWSSPLANDYQHSLRYVDLLGGVKPYLLVGMDNNLGAETRISYGQSTQFYLKDKLNGTPWVTRLPFPVHVVTRVDTYDHIGRNRFSTRYAYHHGYFDPAEREFRGFGMVEQWDSDQYGSFTPTGELPPGTNTGVEAFVPPVHTKTWFHTGVWLGGKHLADYYAGQLGDGKPGEYYRPTGLTDAAAAALLLTEPDLPAGLTVPELREATRTLKGSMLRQEVFADDAAPTDSQDRVDRALRPYTVTQHTYQVRLRQHQGPNLHAVFDTHPAETLTYHYERTDTDPRMQHAITLDVDDYGNVRQQVAIGYGRHTADTDLPKDAQDTQARTLITYTAATFTNPIDDPAMYPRDYRTPLPAETRTYELTGFTDPGGPDGPYGRRFLRTDFIPDNPTGTAEFVDTQLLNYEDDPPAGKCRRPIEHARTLYRPDDFGVKAGNATALLPLTVLEPRALPGRTYQLALTPGLLAKVFVREDKVDLLDGNPAAILGGTGPDQGGYLCSTDLKTSGVFPPEDPDGHWWIPSGRVFLSPARDDTNPGTEHDFAVANFFLPHRFRTPFDTPQIPTETIITYDPNHLLVVDTIDPVGNRVSAAGRDATGNPGPWRIDYRVLQPVLVSDPNRNRTQVAYDILSMVAGTAVMGKPETTEGDTLTGFTPDLTPAQIDALFTDPNPYPSAPGLLSGASTRVVCDLDRFARSRTNHPGDSTQWLPAGVVTLARETHAADPLPPHGLRIQLSYSYSDGTGREIQKKIGAEPGPVTESGPTVDPRWVASGWTILNNKGLPVRQYEPSFTATQTFEYGVTVGVSPVLFYDPPGRVIATLNPDNTYAKVVFDPWKQTTFDTIDTCGLSDPNDPTAQPGDPRHDSDIASFVADYFTHLPDPQTWQSWYTTRAAGQLGDREADAATRSAAYTNTPTTAHLDTLGRPYLTETINKVVCPAETIGTVFAPAHPDDGKPAVPLHDRVILDIEGNQRVVRDADHQGGDPLGRIVMLYDYNMLGTRIHQASMEGGQRWTLADITGKHLCAWDSRGHTHTTTYDRLRRPTGVTVQGTTPNSDPRTLGTTPILVEKIDYGDTHSPTTPGDFDPEPLNLRGRIYQHWDSSGLVTNAQLDAPGNPLSAYDFKGNLLYNTRRLAADYKGIPDWAATTTPALENEYFESRTWFDALSRPIQTLAPHSNQPQATRNVTQPRYNPGGLLDGIDVWLDTTEPDGILDPAATAPTDGVGVNFIGYDAKGQRLRVEYKNNATTRYFYDPNTFRLTHLYTYRGPAFADDCDNPHIPPPRIAAPDDPPEGVHCGLQNLSYTYDAAGTITYIRDNAQQLIFFRNQVVEPSNDYTYDALNRLIRATGREHLGQTGGATNPPAYPDPFTAGLDPNDDQVMGSYAEIYVYDAAGNHLNVKHIGSQPAQPGWTLTYTYDETSQIENGVPPEPLKHNNRLSATSLDPDDGHNPRHYLYDVVGNTTYMPHLDDASGNPNMSWDHADRLHHVSRGGGGQVWYVYDSSGQRVRKVWEKSAALTQERIYLGGFEIYREHPGMVIDPAALERETLHIFDGDSRMALVERRVVGGVGVDPAPELVVRHQLPNHLGSSVVELDGLGQIVSYEEYFSYGSTSYQAVSSQVVTPKRYRYTANEREEETGLAYHSARYYTPWIGRWIACDPAEPRDTTSTYVYAVANPLRFADIDGRAEGDVVHRWLSQAQEAYKKVNIKFKAELGDVAEYAKQGVSRYADEVSKVLRKTEAEHPLAGAGVKQLNPEYVYRKATTIVIDRTIAVKKTIGDLRLIKAVKSGTMGAREFVARSKANFARAVGARWAQTGEISSARVTRDVKKVLDITEKSAQEALPGLQHEVAPLLKEASPVLKGAAPLLKGASALGRVVKPVAVAATILAATESVAHAADSAQRGGSKLDTANKTARAAMAVGSLAGGPAGGIAGGGLLAADFGEWSIHATGGDKRIAETGHEVEGAARKLGASADHAQTAGAVAAGTHSVAEGAGNILTTLVTGPIGWALLAARIKYQF